MKKSNLFLMIGSALLLNSVAAQAGTVLHCKPVDTTKATWFRTLNFNIGREDQVSGDYSGYQLEDKSVVTKFDDAKQWMQPDPITITHLAAGAFSIHLDFHGSMGSDEDDFHLTVQTDGAAVLSGRMMADCGDGNWSDLDSEAFTCTP